MQQQHSSRHFLISRRFLPIFFTQFFGALNDNIFKQVLLLLISYGWLQHVTDASLYSNLAALLFILPYFIFSATAGQIADYYERSQLIRYLKLLEIFVMLFACIGFFTGQVWILLMALFLMGTQSTFFGPIKYAILPDILNEKELIAGNATFQAGTSLAILFGMLWGGVLIFLAQGHMIWLATAVVAIAICGYIASLSILPQTRRNTQITVNWNVFKTSAETLKYSYQRPLIFYILLANSWYWFYGASVLTQIPTMTQAHLHANETIVSLLLTCFSIGVGIGSFFCQKFGKNKPISQLIKPILFGVVGLTIFTFYLAYAIQLPAPAIDHTYDLNSFLSTGKHYHSLIATTLLGIVGGFYIVPLYTMMQHFAPESHRARVIAANNILNAIFMVISAIFAILILSVLQQTIPNLFIYIGILNTLIAGWLVYQLKKFSNIQHNYPN